MLGLQGPLLLACNHPNSFLDSIIINTLFQQPVWSLARGDAFTTSLNNRLLGSFNMLPVYRTSEGVENLSENYKTFAACVDIFRKDGVVQIFSEGKCINEWHLRPLKKGTARLAIKTWEENINLTVLPIGINYSSFRYFGKNIFLNFGNLITEKDGLLAEPDGIRHQLFNKQLYHEMQQLVFEIPSNNYNLQQQKLKIAIPTWKKIILFFPALVGWLIHLPLFLPLNVITKKKAGNSDHYDSIFTSLLFICYPLYALLVIILLIFFTESCWPLLLILLLPFTAWSYIQLKTQLDT